MESIKVMHVIHLMNTPTTIFEAFNIMGLKRFHVLAQEEREPGIRSTETKSNSSCSAACLVILIPPEKSRGGIQRMSLFENTMASTVAWWM